MGGEPGGSWQQQEQENPQQQEQQLQQQQQKNNTSIGLLFGSLPSLCMARQGTKRSTTSVSDAFRNDEDAADAVVPKDAKMPRSGSGQDGTTLATASAGANLPRDGTTASPLEASKQSPSTVGAQLDGRGLPLFVCWLCSRRLESREALDRHALYSRLHQDSIRRLASMAA